MERGSRINNDFRKNSTKLKIDVFKKLSIKNSLKTKNYKLKINYTSNPIINCAIMGTCLQLF